MKKADGILIACILVASILCIILFSLFGTKPTTVNIYINNNLKDSISLNQNTQKTYTSDDGYNTVIIKDGSVFVLEADCKNQVCVKKGKISNKGESIACTPHKFLVEVA